MDYTDCANALEAIESAIGLDIFIEPADLEVELQYLTPTGAVFTVTGIVETGSPDVVLTQTCEVEHDGAVHVISVASIPERRPAEAVSTQPVVSDRVS